MGSNNMKENISVYWYIYVLTTVVLKIYDPLTYFYLVLEYFYHRRG